MITEYVGPWRVDARMAYWDETEDGVVIVSRNGTEVERLDAYRFPIGWRAGSIDRSALPTRVKACARRVMNRLP